jgi:hypothetical protein
MIYAAGRVRGANPFRHWLYAASAALLTQQGPHWRNAEQQSEHRQHAPGRALCRLAAACCQRAAAEAVLRAGGGDQRARADVLLCGAQCGQQASGKGHWGGARQDAMG